VCEPHLDLLALTSRLLKALGASERPGNVSGMLVDVARDLASWFLWTALRFERANIAVELAGTIQLLDETTDSVQLHDYNFEATLDFFLMPKALVSRSTVGTLARYNVRHRQVQSRNWFRYERTLAPF
jgi:hypothetical protein